MRQKKEIEKKQKEKVDLTKQTRFETLQKKKLQKKKKESKGFIRIKAFL